MVELAMLYASLDPFGDHVDADRDSAFEGHRQRLRATHAAETGGERDGARERIVKTLACDRREGLVRALQDALGPDVDPRSCRHLAVHRQAQCFEAPGFLPRPPLRP